MMVETITIVDSSRRLRTVQVRRACCVCAPLSCGVYWLKAKPWLYLYLLVFASVLMKAARSAPCTS